MKQISIAVHRWRLQKQQAKTNPQTAEQKLEALLAKRDQPLPQLSEAALQIVLKKRKATET